MIIATLIEYITGALMELIFHASWWDYSTEPYNINGYVSLSSSLAWGAFSVILFRTLQPVVESFVELYPERYGIYGLSAVTVLYLVDFLLSGAAAFNLRDKLKKLDDMYDMMAEKVQSTKLYSTASEIKEHMWQIAEDISPIEFAEKQARRLEIRKTMLSQDLNFRARRILRAYPKLRSVKEKARDAVTYRIFSIRNKNEKKRKKV